MNHADVQKYMADYLEGDLALGRRALLDAHLDDCERCAQELAGMRATISLLRSMPDPEVPPHLADNVLRRIRAGEGQWTWLDSLQSALAFVASPRVLAPASAAMLALGVLLATGQVQIVIPNGESVPGPIVTARRSGPPAGEVVPSRLAAAQPPASARPVGASAAEEPTGRVHSGAAGPLRVPMGLVRVTEPRVARPPISFDAGSQDFAAIVQLLRAHPPLPRPPLARRPQTVQISSVAAGDGGIGSRGHSHQLEAPGQISTTPAGRDLPSADEWLVLVRRNPVGFANQLAALSLAEQELWVELLARRAGERGSLDELVAALRATGSDRARSLADDFVEAGRSTVGYAPSASRGESSGRAR